MVILNTNLYYPPPVQLGLNYLLCFFFAVGPNYDAFSVEKAKRFLKSCRSYLKSDTSLLWVAFQSNVLADISRAKEDFKQKFDNAKKELTEQRFTFPSLQYNMRNTKQINNVKLGKYGNSKMQETIQKLECGNSSVVGEVPILFQNKYGKNWDKNKKAALKYSIDIIKKRNNKNIVLLHDKLWRSRDIQSILARTHAYRNQLKY